MPFGVYPGSFNPPTVAHLAIARAALDQCGLERVDLVLSRDALGKDHRELVAVEDRYEVLVALTERHPWLGVRIADERLIADLAEGYDVVVLGGDKWAQVIDPSWYGGDADARDAVVDRLPTVACAPRPGHPVPAGDVARAVVLRIDEAHGEVSATAVRDGRVGWMVPEAQAFADRTGAWIDPVRYLATRGERVATSRPAANEG
jgi:hypothetical protein